MVLPGEPEKHAKPDFAAAASSSNHWAVVRVSSCTWSCCGLRLPRPPGSGALRSYLSLWCSFWAARRSFQRLPPPW